MRIVHISDTHLGKVQFNLAEREDDYYSAFTKAIELAISEKPDLVIHTGDLFDSYRPHPRAFVKAFDSLMKLAERGIPLAIIEGNHELGPDVARKQITSPLVNLEALYSRLGYSKLFLRMSGKVERVGDIVLAGLPYKSFGKGVPDAIENLDRKSREICRCPSVLMIHQGVRGLIRTFHPELEFSDIAKTGFDYIAMGHYHNKVVRSSGRRYFAYPGSTEVVELRETTLSDGRKYILSVDLNPDGLEVREIPLETRPFVTFSEKIENTRELYNLIEKLRKYSAESGSKPVIYGKVRVKGSIKPGFPTEEIRRSLIDQALHIIVRESFEKEEGEPEEPIHTGLEDAVHELIRSFKTEEEVRELAIRIFDIWYREGKRGREFVEEVLRMVDES